MSVDPPKQSVSSPSISSKSSLVKLLDGVERWGNKLPDPAILFLVGILIVWGLSWWLSGYSFDEKLPGKDQPIQITNLLQPKQIATFLAGMVKEFASFHPLGVVLVSLLGVGIAEHAGLINCVLKMLLGITPQKMLTPMLLFVAVLSHTAADAGFVLVIPIGGVMFYAAGRHPLVGIAAAFAGVAGGFSANFIPSGIDPLLAGITQESVKLIDPDRTVNPLCNWFFTASSSVLIILLGWFITDYIVEPKMKSTRIDGDTDKIPVMAEPTKRDRFALLIAGLVTILGIALLVAWAIPKDSTLRAPNGSLTSSNPAAPLMDSIVALIFFIFAVPGIIFGFISGTFKSHRDVIQGMTRSMEAMSYYLVLVFFAALFIGAFRESKLGILLAIKGAACLETLPGPVAIVGVILLSSVADLLIGSASAKWALLAPILIPMLMLLGISPEYTQAAYRIGDSTTSIVTPMMPYFPLVVVFCQRYVKGTGIGTVTSMMLPYCVIFLVSWTSFLLLYWALGIPLGIDSTYTYDVAELQAAPPVTK